MQIHQIKPKTKSKPGKRIGRGGKRGTYSGKGQKGQKSRAGRKIRPQIRSAIKTIPKKRGYRFKTIKTQAVIVNLDMIEKKFEKGESVSPQILFEKGLLKKPKGRLPRVKILSKGKLAKAVNISNCEVSKLAKAAIEKAGGKIIA